MSFRFFKSFSLYLTSAILCVFIGCTKSDEELQLEALLASVGEAGSPEALQLPTPSGGNSIRVYEGAPRAASGFCGDGVINSDEHCDKQALGHASCTELGGVGGVVQCNKECHLDISNCITPAVDDVFGGTAETCKCNCDNSSCKGGCISKGTGASQCRFECDNDCICQCEEMLEAHVEECEFDCDCEVDTSGNPDCDCRMTDCEVLAVISPNIANIAAKKLPK